ncbi:MAG: polyphenol oxidase family protein [Elusimicrobia bacterium]|nr:polyphenol oxidase family protein [Elusimicrobiota bacterium]
MTSARVWTEEAGFLRHETGAVNCGFTTRAWGDMRYSRLRQEALAKAGAPEADARLLRQVHGNRISILRGGDDSGVLTQGDGWLTDQPGAVVGVVVADCLPVWIWARSGQAAGVFHAGWRGLEAGLLGAAVAEFSRSFNIRPGDLGASVGPHVGACCYRVGDDVAARFRKGSLRLRGGEVFLDLGDEARTQLLAAGLGADAVGICPDCTACRAGLFYSYRREGGRGPRTGQMLAFLWLAA